jgi:uncharacterized protein (TIGR03435 family)
MNRLHMAFIVICALRFATPGFSQSPLAAKPAFEVATIKQNAAVQGRSRLADQPGGRFVATRINLRTLIGAAYQGNPPTGQLVGGPAWIDSDLWDIEAKAPEGSVPPNTTFGFPPQMILMLQSLLEDRFQLKLHRETREAPIYDLTIVKGGPKLKLSEDQMPPSMPGPAAPPLQPGTIPRGAMKMVNGDFEATALSFGDFAKALAALYLHRPVDDKTGLKGLYDIKLRWTPDPAIGAPLGPGGPVAPVPPTADTSGPDIFTAIQEQLGLKLDSAKGPVEVLVIDSAQKPSGN